MNEKRVALEPAFLLHSKPYQNTSAVIDFITHNAGRVSVIAKGVRGKKPRFNGVLQAYYPLLVSWQGRGELPLLTHAELAQPAILLSGESQYQALYLNELLQRLLPRQEAVPQLFEMYYANLNKLQNAQLDEMDLRYFEFQLLRELGYELLLAQDNNGDALRPDSYYQFVHEHGPIPLSQKTDSVLCFPGSTFLALSNQDLSSKAHLVAAKRIARVSLQALLGAKPLRSRELYRAFIAHKKPI